MYVRLQPNFPTWIWTSTAQYRPFPMDLHHSWGGPFAVEKCYFLVDKVVRNRSIWGPCQFWICHTKHLVKNIPIYFPTSFFPLILLSCFPDYGLKGGLPFLWWSCVSPPYSMYVRLQPNFPKWFEPVLLNPGHFPWISAAWCALKKL